MTRSTLYNLFRIAAQDNLTNPAILYRSETESRLVSYSDLFSECDKVSSALENQKIKHGFIGVCLKQSLHMPAVLLGILQKGLAFTCMDMTNFDENTDFIECLHMQWILSDIKFQNRNWSLHTEIIIHGQTVKLWKHLEGDAGVNKASDTNESTGTANGNWLMAYAVQTTGTTGKQKIVQVPHKCIIPNIQNLQNILAVNSKDVIFLTAPLTFDPSVVEIFLALTSGALLLIVSKSVKSSPRLLLKTLKDVTILEATPSFVLRWSKEEIRNNLLCEKSSLRALLLGGEPCPSLDKLQQWKAKGNKTDIYNIYGITEVSCWASIHKVTFEDGNRNTEIENTDKKIKIPLGNTLYFTQFKVYDHLNSEVLNGEGELYIGSSERICLINNETLQDINYPTYRATGDIVSFDKGNKKIFYLGRKNSIIKRFGYRVCLPRIEEVANLHESVEQSCCVWDENIGKLGLFLQLNGNCKVDKSHKELKIFLSQHLHESHIPDVIIVLNSLPLNSHGKMDQQKLKYLMIEQIKSDFRRLSEIEEVDKILSFLWRSHLCLSDAPNPNDKFAEVGGNSVLAMQLVSELEKVVDSSVCTGLIGMLLGDFTFNDCCKHLFSKLIQIKTGVENSTVMNFNFPSKKLQHKRKPEIAEDERYISSPSNPKKRPKVDNNEHSYLKNDKNALLSICRGRIDIGEMQKPSVCKSLESINCYVQWTFNLGKCVDASPRLLVLANDVERVCVGSHSHKFIIADVKSGTVSAECLLPDRIESSMCISLCGKTGVVGCYDGSVYGIDLKTGNVKWNFPTGDMVKSSPTLCLNGSAVVIGSYDHHLYCINIMTGSIIWSAYVGNGGIYTSPCIAKGVIYVGVLNGTSAAFNENNGKQLWSYKFGSPIFASPAVTPEEDIVIFAEVSGVVHFISTEGGKELWKYKVDGNIFSSFCIQSLPESNMILFGCHDKNLYCLIQHEDSILLKWKCGLDSAIFGTPFVFPVSTAPSSDEKNIVYEVVAASTKGIIYLIDLEYGKTTCSYQLPGEVFSSPVVHGNNIYVGCRDNNLYSLALH